MAVPECDPWKQLRQFDEKYGWPDVAHVKVYDAFDEGFYETDKTKIQEGVLRINSKKVSIPVRIYADYLAEITLKPKKIIKNGPATIVIWSDNTKTVVKKRPEDQDDDFSAVCIAFAKRCFGATSTIKSAFKKAVHENQN